MALDPELKKFLNQTINVASATGVDSYGQSSYAAAAPRAAKVEVKVSLVRTVTGEGDGEVRSSHRIFVEDEILLTDRIWLPGLTPMATNARRPLSVDEIRDEAGAVSHYEVMV